MHHVGLGEELRHGRQFIRADLGARSAYFLLLLRLPELIHPAKRIRCGECLGGQAFHQRFQLLAVLQGEGNVGHGQVGLEHLRQHGVGETGGKRPLVHAFIALPARAVVLFGKRFALVQRDGDAHFRFDEQVVLGQEAGEQHPVPVLVGALLRQMVDGLRA